MSEHEKSLSPSDERLSALAGRASSYQRLKVRQSVGLSRRFVDADAANPREAHRHAGFVPRALVDRIERDFEHQALFDLAHGTEALDGVAADPPVEPAQFLVSEAEIGLADRKQLVLIGPAPERVIAVVARSLSRPALRVHQHAIGSQRIALPFIPEAGAAARDIGAVAALEHDALDGDVAGTGAELGQFVEIFSGDQLRDVEPF